LQEKAPLVLGSAKATSKGFTTMANVRQPYMIPVYTKQDSFSKKTFSRVTFLGPLVIQQKPFFAGMG
jgi:hypothetical protein